MSLRVAALCWCDDRGVSPIHLRTGNHKHNDEHNDEHKYNDDNDEHHDDSLSGSLPLRGHRIWVKSRFVELPIGLRLRPGALPLGCAGPDYQRWVSDLRASSHNHDMRLLWKLRLLERRRDRQSLCSRLPVRLDPMRRWTNAHSRRSNDYGGLHSCHSIDNALPV